MLRVNGCDRVLFDGIDHSGKAGGALGGEVVFKADLFNKPEINGRYIFKFLAVIGADYKGNEARHNCSIAHALAEESSLLMIAFNPDARHASEHPILFGAKFLRHALEFFPKIDQITIF